MEMSELTTLVIEHVCGGLVVTQSNTSRLLICGPFRPTQLSILCGMRNE